uniref:Uncharacterized protein n=1 Tax=Kalanchoe fedtschenkoi TaxID=63787 RepID=A0A7N0UIC7_KALFE
MLRESSPEACNGFATPNIIARSPHPEPKIWSPRRLSLPHLGRQNCSLKRLGSSPIRGTRLSRTANHLTCDKILDSDSCLAVTTPRTYRYVHLD